MQLAEDMVKPLIDGRARNPVGIQVPFLAAIRIFVLVERRIARHQENKSIGRCVGARGKSLSKKLLLQHYLQGTFRKENCYSL